MENHSEDKSKRLLEIYTKLTHGKVIHKSKMSEKYGVSHRTIQRDIADIQCFFQEQLAETGRIQEIIFDKREGGYLLRKKMNDVLREKDVLAVCRLLLESRAFVKDELFPVIQSLIALCSDDAERSEVKSLLQRGMHYYKEPVHGMRIVDKLWLVEQAVKAQRYIEIKYESAKENGQVERKLKPVRVMFMKKHFFLMAFIWEESQKRKGGEVVDDMDWQDPSMYRIDRIRECMVTEEYFKDFYEGLYDY